jgi:hypothetical protein
MRRWLTRAILLTGFSLTISTAASAQLRDNIELNVFGGASWYSSNRYEIGFPQSATPIEGKFRLDSAWRAGLRLGVFTRGHWGQEFLYSYEPNRAHFIRRTAPSSSLDLDIQVHNYGATGLYYFHESEERAVRPFASFGIGGTVYRLTPEAAALVRDPLRGNAPDMDNAHELALHYGFGFKTTRAASRVGFRLDVRGFLGRTPSFGLARQADDPNATVFPASGAIHNAEATAGLIFYFGRR